MRNNRTELDPWSHTACLGYALKAAEKLGYTEEEKKRLARAIYDEFNWTSLDEATAVFLKSLE
ncbi:hypothetical protein [Indiicoccus explosivorum]|uniref:hypothetical protein n=1 Tax=Indiicoccus explosivorum TaxID=1917864 RepID=UPI000B449CF5|nr:hypothetical protein [Indiicoccus explosivorum]